MERVQRELNSYSSFLYGAILMVEIYERSMS